MATKIGITTQLIRQAKWYKYVGELGLGAIEINRQNSKLHFNQYFLDKVKRYLKVYDLSIHSGTAGIFQRHDTFTKANLAILTAEIDLCRILGAKQLVFHLDQGHLSAGSKNELREVIAYAQDVGVGMFYESNSILVADYAYDILDSFPSLGYVLDLGHLNCGYSSGQIGCDVNEFVSQVRDRVTYVHASNNSGRVDEHNGLDYGSMDWRGILDMLDMPRVEKIIIEVRHADMVKESEEALREYLGKRMTGAMQRSAEDGHQAPAGEPMHLQGTELGAKCEPAWPAFLLQ